MNLREKVIERLGGRCEGCGYDRDVRVLSLWAKRKEDRERRESGRKESFFLKVLLEPDLRERFEVLCANCRFERMYNARGIGREVWVWDCGMEREVLERGEVWDDGWMAELGEVFVVARDGSVWRVKREGCREVKGVREESRGEGLVRRKLHGVDKNERTSG